MRHLRDWTWERLRLWRTFKGLQPSKPHWLYPIWTAADLPDPIATAPPTASTTFTFIFSFPFIRHTLVIPHELQIVNKQRSLRQGVFSCCLWTHNLLKTLRGMDWTKLASETSNQPRELSPYELKFGESLQRCRCCSVPIVSYCRNLQWQQISNLASIVWVSFKCGYMGGVVGV